MESKAKFIPNPKKRLMDQVREVLRYHHYAYRTEQIYCQWIVRFVKFYESKRHPREMGAPEVQAFLSHLASDRDVAASTQKQALNALVFLYRHVLDQPLAQGMDPRKASRGMRPPTVLTEEEVSRLLDAMEGVHRLMAQLMYGSGLRLMECIRLRVKDLDFGQGQIFVRDGKGGKDRVTILPTQLHHSLKAQLEKVSALHRQDLSEGAGEVYLPLALDRKYTNAGKSFEWQYVFPARKSSIDPRSGKERRHHVMENGLQKAVKRAALATAIPKRISTHTLRHSFATHMLEHGIHIRALQELMGHADVKTTEIYTHVMKKDIKQWISPLDRIMG